ncbi:MAG: hypothetical protein HZB24_09115 [Desulfobacterales bacterium]|nr:hypothetical protein [Desulfobacterales bacterium]
MPAPLGTALSASAKLNFAGQDVRLPVNWRNMGPLYARAFTPAEQHTQSNTPTNLFHEPTSNRYHTGAARTVGQSMERYIDGICAAIADALAKWMKMASVSALTINGPIGTLLPGGVTGPPLKPFILAKAPRGTEMEREYSQAIAEAVSDGWFSWQQGLSGVLNFPAFAAAPMPMAPPTPNTPAPLVTFGSSGESALTPVPLKNAMAAALRKNGQHAAALFEAMAQSVCSHFQTFKTSTVVSHVMGTGPVAVAPSGPVTGGAVIPTPGNFV